MSHVNGVVGMLEEHLALSSSSWSIGVPGAIAEFHRSERDEMRYSGARTVTTSLGAIRLEPSRALGAHAYEILTVRPETWHHGVVVTLPGRAAAMSGRRALTEIGPDRDAIRVEDREAILFDLGLASPYCDFFVRTSDRAQVDYLRSAAGRSLLDCRALYDDIVDMSPHRVFATRLGRVEIFQRIARAGAHTPQGPHTHLLPRLYRRERSHLPAIGLPAEHAPCLTLYPANPVLDAEGLPKRFDAGEHERFQRLLRAYGCPIHLAAKDAAWRTMRAGAPADRIALPEGRRARVASRIAVRQLSQMDRGCDSVAAWRAKLEPRARTNA